MNEPRFCCWCDQPVTGPGVVDADDLAWRGRAADLHCSIKCLDAHNDAREAAAGGVA